MELPSESYKSSVCNGQNQLTYQPDEFVNQLFDEFCSANTFKNISKLFEDLCQTTGINSEKSNLIYNLLKLSIKSWKAQNVWSKLDKKMAGWEYADGTACNNTKVIVIGCGPCGLRVAIEAALLGCKVVVVEKRDGFTRNNVLHLWPFLIHDLKSLGAKHFFGRFCSGSIDHISIRTLQCILLKVALLLGVEIHAGVEFVALCEPQDCNEGWKAELIPSDHVVSQFAFDVCISADGKRNTMPEFKRKEFRGKLAIAITANFINHKTKAEASVEEISGVSYIFNQKFFKDLSQETGIDLENIVYYKDETHYFVMTAKKHNLLIKKVLLQDFDDPEMLLSSTNVDQEALMSYAIQAAEFSTNYKLPKLEFAHNHYGRPDVSMFDFTSMFAAENACRVVERCDTKLLLGLVGDTLLEPFWPTGSGCARGFLSALDAAWMIRSWSLRKMSVLHIIAERESIYQLLSQTTSENLHKNYVGYSTDPSTRYVNLNLQSIYPEQVRHLFDGTNMERSIEVGQNVKTNIKYKQYDMCEKYKLMRWCQMQLESYDKLVRVVDMYSSWKNGIALSALIHRYKPDVIDVYSLDSRMALQNVQKAIVILEKEFGVVAEFDAEDILTSGVQVENILTSYLMQFREIVSTNQLSSASKLQETPKDSLLESKISLNGSEKNKATEKPIEEKDSYIKSLFVGKNNLSSFADKTVSVIAQNLSMKLEGRNINNENTSPASSLCHSCKSRVYLVQRLMAEGLIFHRNCFRCSYCSTCLHKDYYAHCKITDEDKFFCKHHYGLSRPSPSQPDVKVKETNAGHTKSKHRPAKKTKISERAEYTTESEMGENEDDQTRHNLISAGSTNKSETEFSTSEEELQFLVDEPSDEEPDFAWAQVAKLYSTQSNEKVAKLYSTQSNEKVAKLYSTQSNEKVAKLYSTQSNEKVRSDSIKFSSRTFDLLKVRTTSIVSLDSTSEVDTVGGSDADWETDTEIEVESQETVETVKNDKTATTTTVSLKEGPILQREISVRSSIRSSAISNNRMAFFSAPTQPVRIDARTFLGLDKEEKPDEIVVEESSQMIEKVEDVVNGGNDELSSNKQEHVEDLLPKNVVVKSKVKRLKLKSKKFTKKRRKDEKRKTRSVIISFNKNKSINEEDSSAENNEKHVSPSCTVVKKMKRDGTTESDESKVDYELFPRDQASSVVAHTDVIEMMASQWQHPPCLENNLVQLSSDSEMSQDDQPTLNEDIFSNTKESSSSEENVVSVLIKKVDEVEESSGSGNNVGDENTSSLQCDEHSGIPSDDLFVEEDDNLKSRKSSKEEEHENGNLIESSPSPVNGEETFQKDKVVVDSCPVSNGACKELNGMLRFPHRSTSFDGCLKLAAAIDSLLRDDLCSEDENEAEFKKETSSVNDAKIFDDAVKDNSCLNKVSVSSSIIADNKIQEVEKNVETKSNWSLTSNFALSKSLVSPGKFTDAKRRFFCEPPQPVRIDHRTLFGDLSCNNRDSLRSDSSSTLSRQTVETVSSDNKTDVGIRPDSILSSDRTQTTNATEDSADRVGHKISSSNETTMHSDRVLPVDELSIQHSEQANKLELTEQPRRPLSPFDSAEIMKDLKNILGDKPSFSAIKENYFSDPETSCKVGSNSKNLMESFKKKDKIFSVGKDKRKSFLSKIIQIKHDRKEKNDIGSCSQATKQSASKQQNEPLPTSAKYIIKEKTNSLPLEKKKVCKKKMFESKVAFKSRSQGSKCEGIGGQSVYEEMAPIMEGIKKVEQRNREKNNIKERVHVIAPPLPKPHSINLVPPKADLDDFETESELGEERLSIWSLHSQLQNISEEESSKQRKKQLRLIRRKHKEKEMARMQVVQEVMRKLEDIEIQQQQVEERGVQIERILRGERTEQERLLDEVFLIQEWFNAIQEKNFLNRYESELIVQTRELELEDKQCQLQLQLQETMFQDEVTDRTREQEHEILQELVDVVEKRDKLVLLLEEERLKHKQYDRNLQKIMEERGFLLNTGLAVVSHESTFS